jgi:hypothetical protein
LAGAVWQTSISWPTPARLSPPTCDWLFGDDGLADGGAISQPAVVVDSGNWEKLHAAPDRPDCRPGGDSRGAAMPGVYAWEVPDRLGDEHVAHLVFVFGNGGQIEPHEHVIMFRPFAIGEPRARLELAGLREVGTGFDASRDRYTVVTVTT